MFPQHCAAKRAFRIHFPPRAGLIFISLNNVHSIRRACHVIELVSNSPPLRLIGTTPLRRLLTSMFLEECPNVSHHFEEVCEYVSKKRGNRKSQRLISEKVGTGTRGKSKLALQNFLEMSNDRVIQHAGGSLKIAGN